MQHSILFCKAAWKATKSLDKVKLERLANALSHLKGRLFILGLGGSAANASHAVNDLFGRVAQATLILRATQETSGIGVPFSWVTFFSGS